MRRSRRVRPAIRYLFVTLDALRALQPLDPLNSLVAFVTLVALRTFLIPLDRNFGRDAVGSALDDSQATLLVLVAPVDHAASIGDGRGGEEQACAQRHARRKHERRCGAMDSIETGRVHGATLGGRRVRAKSLTGPPRATQVGTAGRPQRAPFHC